MVKFGTIVILASFLILAVSSTCFAQAKAGATEASPMTKLGNGLANVLTGWMEIPRCIGETSKEENLFAGLTIGTLKGLCYFMGRTLVGVIDTVTFVIKPYDQPIMEPRYHF